MSAQSYSEFLNLIASSAVDYGADSKANLITDLRQKEGKSIVHKGIGYSLDGDYLLLSGIGRTPKYIQASSVEAVIENRLGQIEAGTIEATPHVNAEYVIAAKAEIAAMDGKEAAPHADKTVSADRFAAIMSRWPSDQAQLGFIAEVVLEDGKGEPHDDFGKVFTLEGDEIVMRQHEGDTFRTDAAEYMEYIEREYPDQMAHAKGEVERKAAEAAERQQERDAHEGGDHSAEIDAIIGEISFEADMTPEAAAIRDQQEGDLFRQEQTAAIATMREQGVASIEHDFGTWSLEEDTLTLTNLHGSVSWHVDDLETDIDPTAEILTMDGQTMTADEIATVHADKADADEAMRLAAEIEHGFPSLDPMFDDLNRLQDTQRQIGISPEPSDRSADRANVVDFGAMADRARSASSGIKGEARALETEQGA